VNTQRALRSAIHFVSLMAGILLIFFFVQTFGNNVPLNDDWDHVETSLLWIENGVSAGSLFALHNEHCLAIPRIWNHLILLGTHGDFKAVLLLNAGLAVLLLGLLIWFISTLKLPWLISVLASITVALAVSAWCQWQNLLWAFQAPFFMLPMFAFGGALLVSRLPSDIAALIAGVAITWLSVVTNGNGFFVAWALLPVVLLRGRVVTTIPARFWTAAYSVNLLFVTAFALSLIARSSGKSYGGASDLIKQPEEIVFAGLSVLGSAFVPSQVFHGENSLAFVFGLLSVCAALAFAMIFWLTPKKSDFVALGPPLALAIYGLLSVAAVAYGRSQLLLTNPIESRYQSFAIWWIIGLLLAGCWLLPKLTGRILAVVNALICMIALALSLGTLYAMPLFYKHGENMRTATESVQQVLKKANDPSSVDRLKEISTHYGVERIRKDLRRLESSGLLHQDLSPTGGQ
jgi:hypothetical protein